MKPEMSRQLIFTGACAGLLLLADPVWATQTHGEPEGLFVHQIAHVFFIISMGSLDFWLRQRNLIKERGWKYIQLAAVLFIIWNIDAFLVHLLDEHLDILGVTKVDLWHIQIESHPEQNSIALLYYLLKLDHLLCVPAMFFLYFGLQTILKNTSASNANRHES